TFRNEAIERRHWRPSRSAAELSACPTTCSSFPSPPWKSSARSRLLTRSWTAGGSTMLKRRYEIHLPVRHNDGRLVSRALLGANSRRVADPVRRIDHHSPHRSGTMALRRLAL